MHIIIPVHVVHADVVIIHQHKPREKRCDFPCVKVSAEKPLHVPLLKQAVVLLRLRSAKIAGAAPPLCADGLLLRSHDIGGEVRAARCRKLQPVAVATSMRPKCLNPVSLNARPSSEDHVNVPSSALALFANGNIAQRLPRRGIIPPHLAQKAAQILADRVCALRVIGIGAVQRKVIL